MMPVYGSQRSLILMEEELDSPNSCRERRRRRIEMRRKLASDHRNTKKLPPADINENSEPSPAYGSMSVVGRAREMEDEISVKMNFCRPKINGYRPVHFFAVFDGHGGHQVSALCKENMHVIVEQELMRVKLMAEGLTGGELEEVWRKAINRSFERMDDMALTLCQCDGVEKFRVCRYHPQLSMVGSTAVVVLLTQEYIIVGNCGDSRAVLCRNGQAVPLSVDQKPDREDERARIEALGGRILFSGNGARVEGILAMTRAIGDRFLKQVVTSEPEYIFMKREAEDVSLILGSDGLWDVLSSELSCEVVHKCQQENLNSDLMAVHDGGPLYTTMAAAILVRFAMGRRSTDNISVIVVDLKG
ncbi:hypothetical protein L1987_52849 [Smallanthus sonchifolius]|uniref:Uncharacterized protein n=1 Tax=Smallanthus sonchifolius TaxID=185202 RepID=A0ACB9ETY4_9ASTR|nr:hypothetical protein L1987_52849 [Smallanthus sonchifolius]